MAGDPGGLVGRRILLVFDAMDATPDLGDFGPLGARVTGVEDDPSMGAPWTAAQIDDPPELVGLTVLVQVRYEEESIALAGKGRPVTVNAQIRDTARRVVGGGIATLQFKKS